MLKRGKRYNAKRPRSQFHYFRHHPFVVPVVAFLFMFFGSLAGFILSGGQTIGASDLRVVRLHVNGDEQVVPTRAKTVGDFLERRGITVGEKDILEPPPKTPINDDSFEINYYEARELAVSDGTEKKFIVTAKPNPTDVAEEAGFTVYPEDKVTLAAADLSNPFEAIDEGLVPEQVIIERATLINLNLYGAQVEVRTHAATVGEMLNEKQIFLVEGDNVIPGTGTPVLPGMQVFVTRAGVKLESEERNVPVPTEYIEDESLPLGTLRVQKEGADGLMVVTYQIEEKDGKKTRTIIQEVVVRRPVKRIVARGTRSAVAGSNAELLRMLRMCETGGNYQTNTGNGYYGAYQFSIPTWNSMGTGYPRADLAPAAVQDDATLRLARRSGFHSQFPGCSSKLGLPAYPY